MKKEIEYNFTAVPTQLMILLDVNCRSMLFTLCQLHSYYANEDGIFFRTNGDLSSQSQLSQKLVIATIDTLYRNSIIEVWSIGKGKGKECNKYRLNLNKFKEYEQYSMDDLKNPELQIETIKEYNKKGYTPQYLKDNEMEIEIHKNRINLPQEIQTISPNLPPITNNIDNKENINNEDNIKNEENLNIIKDKEIIDNKKNEEHIEGFDLIKSYQNKMIELEKKYNSNYYKILRHIAQEDYNCFLYFIDCWENSEECSEEYAKYFLFIHELKSKYRKK